MASLFTGGWRARHPHPVSAGARGLAPIPKGEGDLGKGTSGKEPGERSAVYSPTMCCSPNTSLPLEEGWGGAFSGSGFSAPSVPNSAPSVVKSSLCVSAPLRFKTSIPQSFQPLRHFFVPLQLAGSVLTCWYSEALVLKPFSFPLWPEALLPGHFKRLSVRKTVLFFLTPGRGAKGHFL